MTDLEDEKRIKEYMEAKMTHIKMYNECMNLADGLDVAKFAELVRADEREACAKVCEQMSWPGRSDEALWKGDASDECAAAIRARGEK